MGKSGGSGVWTLAAACAGVSSAALTRLRLEQGVLGVLATDADDADDDDDDDSDVASGATDASLSALRVSSSTAGAK